MDNLIYRMGNNVGLHYTLKLCRETTTASALTVYNVNLGQIGNPLKAVDTLVIVKD